MHFLPMCYFSTCTLWFLTDLFEKASYDVLHYRSDQSKNMIIYWIDVLRIKWCNIIGYGENPGDKT